MAVTNAKDLFVALLSNVRNQVERSGKIRMLSNKDLAFVYRNSGLPEGAIVTKAIFKMQKGDKQTSVLHLSYGPKLL